MYVPTPVLPPAEDPRYTWPERLWPATPEGVHEARHALVATLCTWGGEWGRASLVDNAALVLAELMANAQRHALVPHRPPRKACRDFKVERCTSKLRRAKATREGHLAQRSFAA